MAKLVWLAAMVAVPALASAQSPHDHGASPYAGEQSRAIKSLSEADIAELQRGGGWGLAKAAELNGVPGPAHLLELKDAIALSPDQVKAIEAIHKTMKEAAIAEGGRLIALERELDAQFRNRTATDESLRQILANIAESRRTLSYIHLSAHLTTPPLLSREQIERYNTRRGYAENPCGAAPAGHDPAMWRKHNGCD
jgi:HPt (histidine-containing phosphotransfer) domain-containing protein